MSTSPWLESFLAELEAIGHSLPSNVRWSLKRERNGAENEEPA
jgi:hypothetical protein